MLSKFSLNKWVLNNPNLINTLRVLILLLTLIVAFFVKTGTVSADPGWGVVGG